MSDPAPTAANEARAKKKAGGFFLATFLSCLITGWLASYIVEFRNFAGPRAAAAFGAPALALVVLLLFVFRRRLRDGVKRAIRENVPPPRPR